MLTEMQKDILVKLKKLKKEIRYPILGICGNVANTNEGYREVNKAMVDLGYPDSAYPIGYHEGNGSHWSKNTKAGKVRWKLVNQLIRYYNKKAKEEDNE